MNHLLQRFLRMMERFHQGQDQSYRTAFVRKRVKFDFKGTGLMVFKGLIFFYRSGLICFTGFGTVRDNGSIFTGFGRFRGCFVFHRSGLKRDFRIIGCMLSVIRLLVQRNALACWQKIEHYIILESLSANRTLNKNDTNSGKRLAYPQGIFLYFPANGSRKKRIQCCFF